nr:hypothetical protein [Escherichia coli]
MLSRYQINPSKKGLVLCLLLNLIPCQWVPPGSSLVAYMPHTGLLINDDNFLPEMREELDVINRQVESYNDELSLLRSMSAQFLKCGNQKLYSYLSGYNHLISEADASYAENALRSEYWKRVMALTDVLSVMSDEKKKEWDKQFTADRYHLPPQEIPDFYTRCCCYHGCRVAQ